MSSSEKAVKLNRRPTKMLDISIMGFVSLFLLLILGGAFLSLGLRAGESDFLNVVQSKYLQRVFSFTILQAVLSTAASLAIAIPLARFFFFYNFPGRNFILTIFGLCLVMPVIVVILGIIQIHGNSGITLWLLSHFMEKPEGYLYGLTGILIAHIFFNAPLAMRTILARMEAIPAEQWRIAAQLNLTSWQRFKLIELPALRGVLPGVSALILMLCFTSFAIILTLGGGPKATTLEVAIYQALRFDFNLSRAITLSALQLLICGSLTFFLIKSSRQTETEISFQTSAPALMRLVGNRSKATFWPGILFLILSLLLIFPPLLSILVKGLLSFQMDYLTKPAVYEAILTSAIIALAAGSFSVLSGISLGLGLRHLGNRKLGSFVETIGSIILVFSPFALASGLFLILFPLADIDRIAPFLVIIINGIMALPFVLRILIPAFKQRFQEMDPLCQSLGISGWQRFKLIDLPLLRKPIGLSMAYAATLSIGDFGIIALFGSEGFMTLPLYLYRAMGSYRMDEAAFMAIILMLACYILFVTMERLIGGVKD